MKKNMFLACALALGASFGLQAQTGPYARIALGGALGATSDVLGTDTNVSSTGEARVSNIYNTIGSGLTGSVAGGYFFTEHLGVDLEFQSLYGRRTLASQNVNEAANTEATVHAYTRQFRALPSLVARSGGETISGYARAGLLLPLGGSTYRENYNRNAGGDEAYTDLRVNGALSLGFVAGVGLSYKLSDLLSLDLECTYTGLRIKGAKAEITRSSVERADGTSTDFLENATVFQKEIRFVDELNSESNELSMQGPTGLDTSKPNDQLASRTNFSNIGISLGLRFSF